MKESDVKSALVKVVRFEGGYGRRIEDQFGVGILDTIIIPKGYPVFFIEAKIIKGKTFGPTPRQYIEMLEILDADQHDLPSTAVPVLLGWMNGVHYFRAPIQETTPDDCLAQTLGESPIATLKRWWDNNSDRQPKYRK